MTKQKTSKNDPEEDLNNGITAISVQGFKSLAKESRIEIRPLTILAGANSSGKSSIMQPLLLMKQTLEASYDPGPLLLNGPNAKFTSVNQFISRLQKDSNGQAFSVEIEHDEYPTHKISFSLIKDQALEIRDMIIGGGAHSLHLVPHQRADDLEKAISEFFGEEMKCPKLPEGLQWVVLRNRCFLSIAIETLRGKDIFPGGAKSKIISMLSTIFSTIFSTSIDIDEELPRMIHVPGFRGNPERAYKVTTPGPDFPGTFENYVATIIAQWQARHDDRLKMLGDILADLGLTWKVSASAVDDTQIELQVGRLPQPEPTDDLVSIADVGFGVSQVLPVLVALLIAEPAQLVYLEQPELHLHPRAQHGLAKILVETAKRGVKLVVETHSAVLLLRMQTSVAEGNLDPGLVKLHWFSRKSDDGTTSIQSADLDTNGAFGDWPEDFGEVELMAEAAYLNAVEERSKNNGKGASPAIGN